MPVSSTVNPVRSQARAAETRAGILEAAGKIFAEAGLAGARTDAIAAAAGVNKALLYYYFKSKEALYLAVIEDHVMEFNGAAMKVLTGTGSARSVLLKYVTLHFDFISARLRDAPLYQQMMMTGGESMTDLIRRYIVPRSEALQKVLDRGMRSGEFRRADGMHTAISIIAVIVFYFTAAPVFERLGHSDAYSKTNLKRRKKEVLDFVRHSIFADPKAPLP